MNIMKVLVLNIKNITNIYFCKMNNLNFSYVAGLINDGHIYYKKI